MRDCVTTQFQDMSQWHRIAAKVIVQLKMHICTFLMSVLFFSRRQIYQHFSTETNLFYSLRRAAVTAGCLKHFFVLIPSGLHWIVRSGSIKDKFVNGFDILKQDSNIPRMSI